MRREGSADKRQDQVPNAETTELLTLIEKYPAIVLTLLVRTRDTLKTFIGQIRLYDKIGRMI